MTILIILFLGSLLLGQLGGISLSPGVVVYVHDVFLLILLVSSLHKIRLTNLRTPLLVFVGACVVSLAANYGRFPLAQLGLGSLYLLRWIGYAALFFVVMQDRKHLHLWRDGLYAVGVGFALLGLVQFILYPYLRNLYYLGWDPHYYRVFSTLFDPNFMGIILVFTLLLGFSLRTEKTRLWIISGESIAFVALLLTYSRSSYLAFMAAVFVWAALMKKWGVIVLIAAFAGLVILLPHVPGNTLNITRLDSTLARIGNWQESLTLIAKAPLFGFGFDTLRYLHAPTAIISKSASGLDSSILFVFATTGVIGLAAYVFLLISLFRLALGPLKTAYIASLTALLVHSLFVNSLFYAWVMIWMWILAGIVTYDR
jgi:O-antigen ligase